ncbi:nuclease-related domain-containing protein [Luteimonas sp. A649]
MLLGLVPFFASTLLALACALTFKAIRARSRRRSPLMGRKLGHLPGQQLLKRIADHHDQVVDGIMLMFLALPLMFTAWAGLRIDWAAIKWGGTETVFLVVGLGVFVYAFWGYVRAFLARDRASDGLVAERVTGMQLNRLVANGCAVLHDLPGDDFNIDHVVVSPRGVYVVETKSFRKAKHLEGDEACRVTFDGDQLVFPDFRTRKPLDQAVRNAHWVARELRETLGRDVPVMAAVALPGWFVTRTEAGKRSTIIVFTPMGKGAEFMTWEPVRLSPDERGTIAKALAVRYPSLE